jgi:hypothetical protein
MRSGFQIAFLLLAISAVFVSHSDAGAVRSIRKSAPSNGIARVSGSLLDAVADTSDSTEAEKANKTLARIFKKIEVAKVMERKEQNAMDEVYTEKRRVLLSAYNHSCVSAEAGLKMKVTTAENAFRNEKNNTFNVIDNLERSIANMKIFKTKAKEVVAEELRFRQSMYPNGTCCVSNGIEPLTKRVDMLVARLTVERQRAAWKRKMTKRMKSIEQLIKAYSSTATASSKRDTQVARNLGKTIISRAVQFMEEASKKGRLARLGQLTNELTLLADIRSGLAQKHILFRAEGNVRDALQSVIGDQNLVSETGVGELRAHIKTRCEKRIAKFGGDGEVCNDLFVMHSETLFRDYLSKSAGMHEETKPVMFTNPTPFEHIPPGATGISMTGATGVTGSAGGVSFSNEDDEKDAAVSVKGKGSPTGMEGLDELGTDLSIGSTNSNPCKGCEKKQANPSLLSNVVSATGNYQITGASSGGSSTGGGGSSTGGGGTSAGGGGTSTGGSGTGGAGVGGSLSDRPSSSFASSDKASRTVDKPPFGEDEGSTVSPIEESAGAIKEGNNFEKSKSQIDQLKADFELVCDEHKRVSNARVLDFFKGPGKGLKNSEHIDRINSCFKAVSSKTSISEAQFIRVVMCTVGAKGENIPRVDVARKMKLAEEYDSDNYVHNGERYNEHKRDFEVISDAVNTLANAKSSEHMENAIGMFSEVLH